MSKRTEILDEIKNTLEQIDIVKTIEVDRIDVVDISKMPLPAIFIYGGKDKLIDDLHPTIGFETWDWDIVLEVWSKNTATEELLAVIHRTIHNNYKLNGLVVYSKRVGADTFIIDPAKFIKSMIIKYQVVYRHPLGQP